MGRSATGLPPNASAAELLDRLPPLSDYLVKPYGDTAMDLGEWLRGLGLGHYEATFREHEIDADVLPDLIEADLEKIGLPLGARKRVMKVIVGLASKAAPSSGASGPPPKTSRRARLQQIDLAERRPITVMFCDLVGSTALAACRT